MLNLNKEKKSLIPFLMAGYPSLGASELLISALIEEGIQVLEIGIPYSDPLADGPVIQAVASQALAEGTKLKDVFHLVDRIRAQHDVSIVLFSYLNPILKYGIGNFVRSAADSGARATLTVDLPPEEADSYLRLHRECGLNTVFLASPTTHPTRLPMIAQSSSGFIYYVSRAGVTGEKTDVSRSLSSELAPMRKMTDLPIAVGFGISNPKQAAYVAQSADAVVIGSRFLTLIAESSNIKEAQNRIRGFARSCLDEMNGVPSELHA